MKLARHAPRLRKRLATLAIATLLSASLSGCARHREAWLDLPLPKLANDFEPLRSQFNRDTGKVRVLMLLDPT
jgi:hypothetical protein